MIRRASIGLLMLVVFMLTRGVAHSLPIESAVEPPNSSDKLMFADLNDDQLLTGADFSIFRKCYIEGGPDCAAVDFDDNQAIDLVDFGYLAAAFRGDTANLPSQTVSPEPATLLLVAAGCTLIAFGRRKGRRSS